MYAIDLRSGSLVAIVTLREADARALAASSEPLTVMGSQAEALRLLGAEGAQDGDKNANATTIAAIAGGAAGAYIFALLVILLVRRWRGRASSRMSGTLTPALVGAASTLHYKNPLYVATPDRRGAATSPKESLSADQRPAEVWPAQAWMPALAEDIEA